MTPLDIRAVGDRCYFEPFNALNDQDPKSRKGGVQPYRFAWWGRLLTWLGWATALKSTDNKIYYVSKSDLERWIARHNGPKKGDYYARIAEICKNQVIENQKRLEEENRKRAEEARIKGEIAEVRKGIAIVRKVVIEQKAQVRVRQFVDNLKKKTQVSREKRLKQEKEDLEKCKKEDRYKIVIAGQTIFANPDRMRTSNYFGRFLNCREQNTRVVEVHLEQLAGQVTGVRKTVVPIWYQPHAHEHCVTENGVKYRLEEIIEDIEIDGDAFDIVKRYLEGETKKKPKESKAKQGKEALEANPKAQPQVKNIGFNDILDLKETSNPPSKPLTTTVKASVTVPLTEKPSEPEKLEGEEDIAHLMTPQIIEELYKLHQILDISGVLEIAYRTINFYSQDQLRRSDGWMASPKEFWTSLAKKYHDKKLEKLCQEKYDGIEFLEEELKKFDQAYRANATNQEILAANSCAIQGAWNSDGTTKVTLNFSVDNNFNPGSNYYKKRLEFLAKWSKEQLKRANLSQIVVDLAGLVRTLKSQYNFYHNQTAAPYLLNLLNEVNQHLKYKGEIEKNEVEKKIKEAGEERARIQNRAIWIEQQKIGKKAQKKEIENGKERAEQSELIKKLEMEIQELEAESIEKEKERIEIEEKLIKLEEKKREIEKNEEAVKQIELVIENGHHLFLDKLGEGEPGMLRELLSLLQKYSRVTLRNFERQPTYPNHRVASDPNPAQSAEKLFNVLAHQKVQLDATYSFKGDPNVTPTFAPTFSATLQNSDHSSQSITIQYEQDKFDLNQFAWAKDPVHLTLQQMGKGKEPWKAINLSKLQVNKLTIKNARLNAAFVNEIKKLGHLTYLDITDCEVAPECQEELKAIMAHLSKKHRSYQLFQKAIESSDDQCANSTDDMNVKAARKCKLECKSKADGSSELIFHFGLDTRFVRCDWEQDYYSHRLRAFAHLDEKELADAKTPSLVIDIQQLVRDIQTNNPTGIDLENYLPRLFKQIEKHLIVAGQQKLNLVIRGLPATLDYSDRSPTGKLLKEVLQKLLLRYPRLVLENYPRPSKKDLDNLSTFLKMDGYILETSYIADASKGQAGALSLALRKSEARQDSGATPEQKLLVTRVNCDQISDVRHLASHTDATHLVLYQTEKRPWMAYHLNSLQVSELTIENAILDQRFADQFKLKDYRDDREPLGFENLSSLTFKNCQIDKSLCQQIEESMMLRKALSGSDEIFQIEVKD
jgi:hypothetical protein